MGFPLNTFHLAFRRFKPSFYSAPFLTIFRDYADPSFPTGHPQGFVVPVDSKDIAPPLRKVSACI
jgi:hypothetical protein